MREKFIMGDVKTANERLSHVDVLKGMGIILVILQHCIPIVAKENMILKSISDAILSFHMPLFFVASGYLYKLGESKTFFTKKVFSLLLPTIIFQGLNFLLSIVLLYCGYYSYSEVVLFAGFWFLQSLFNISCVYYIFDNIFTCNKTKKTFLFAIISVFTLVLGLLYAYKNPGDQNSIAISCIGFFFYTLGVALRAVARFIKKTKCSFLFENRVCSLIVGILALSIVFLLSGKNIPVFMYMNLYGNPIIFVLTAVLGSISLYLLSRSIQSNPIMEFFGKNSLIILLTHFPVYKIVMKSMTVIFSNEYLSLTIGFLIVLLIETIIVKFVNRYCPFIIGKISFN